jgi:hypothetical protein
MFQQNKQTTMYWPGNIKAESLVEDDEIDNNSNKKKVNTQQPQQQNNSEESIKIIKPQPGGPFSAIISSMIPQDLLITVYSKLNENLTNEYDKYYYDEFAFKVLKSENSEQNFFKKTFQEDSKHKLKWIAYLEFNLNSDLNTAFELQTIKTLNKCEKLKFLIRDEGISHSLRPFIWLRISGAYEKKTKSMFNYADIVKKSLNSDLHTSKQIEKDLLRTLPTNTCFQNLHSIGISRLRRILQTIAYIYPTIGYCQGMGSIVATLLLFCEEEDSFWLMCTIIENLLPASYYSHTLIGLQADMKVLNALLSIYLPNIFQLFQKYEIELSLICVNWFLTLFSNSLHMRMLLRIWDLLFYDGTCILFQISLAMLKLNEASLLECECSSSIYHILNDIPSNCVDINKLIEMKILIASSVNSNLIQTQRIKHQAYLLAQNGSFIDYKNLPIIKEKPLFKRNELNNHENNSKLNTLNKFLNFFRSPMNNGDLSTSVIDSNNQTSNKSLSATNELETSTMSQNEQIRKIKNILKTEIMINLRECIMKIVNYFRQNDAEKYFKAEMNANYNIESHLKDYEVYMAQNKVENTFKHAKAICDFQSNDKDELVFKRNDLIKILSIKDEHCWIGELNDRKGWFPAQFVELIDERNGKLYSKAGDDAINDTIRDLIRGEFCLILKQILEYGFKRIKILGGLSHLWTFIEQSAKKLIEKDFNSVFSRLNLCNTYRLDYENKVLTPEEMMFRSIQNINMTHTKADSDVKFRTFICTALNEQLLHIWLEILCSNVEIIENYYEQYSFIRSPGWVQIKCELRLLAQFSFHLNLSAELSEQNKDLAVNECIRDMLIKHHLFSWDIN